MPRNICYISGTRADFGLMRKTLQAIHHTPELKLSLVVTGMHLEQSYGHTVDDIIEANLPITDKVAVDLSTTTGAMMARNIGKMLTAFVDSLVKNVPDVVLLLGDRGEMLAGALAAIHLNIPVVHLHGGERSGTVDELIRHAISKLSHFHFTATQAARDRLIGLGERADRVMVTGAPGLDDTMACTCMPRKILMRQAKLDDKKPVALVIYHPVLQTESTDNGIQYIMESLLSRHIQVMALEPNADAGRHRIHLVLERYAAMESVCVVAHLKRADFISWMAAVDIMIGNSSAGIIEAASLGTPVVNVGSRQNLRERNDNVIDVPVEKTAIDAAIEQALLHGPYDKRNRYGDGKASFRIVSLLKSIPLDSTVLEKVNAY